MVQSKKTGLSCYCCESMDIGLLLQLGTARMLLHHVDTKRCQTGIAVTNIVDVISSQDYKKRSKTNQV